MGTYIKLLKDIKLSDLNSVGGKNASLGEMISGLSRTGVKVPEGFAITVDAYWELLKENSIEQK
jgi:pyruvate,water dikinase